MDKGMNFFYILSAPLGYVMEWIYNLLPNYGWDIILFTLLINIVKIPLQLKGTGVDGVALVSAIFAAKDIEAECRELRALSEQIIK